MTTVIDVGCATIESGGKVHESRRALIERFAPEHYIGFDPQADDERRVLGTGVTLLRVHPWAAWTRDGTIGFIERNAPLSSHAAEGENIPQVPCVNLARFIGELPQENGDVVLKLDCEGAEAKLLAALLLSGAWRRVRTVLVEWHGDLGIAEDLVDELQARGIEVEEWDAAAR